MSSQLALAPLDSGPHRTLIEAFAVAPSSTRGAACRGCDLGLAFGLSARLAKRLIGSHSLMCGDGRVHVGAIQNLWDPHVKRCDLGGSLAFVLELDNRSACRIGMSIDRTIGQNVRASVIISSVSCSELKMLR